MEKTSRNDPKQAYFRKSMHLKVLNMLITPSKPGFSLKIHSRLLVGSFWAIKHLPKLKIAKISFLLASCASRDNWSSGLVNLTLYVAGSINFGRIFIIYTPNESSWKSSITKYHSQSCVGTLNHANWPQIALLEHSFLMFTWLANGLSLKYWVLCSRVWQRGLDPPNRNSITQACTFWKKKVRYLRHLKRYLKNSYRFRILFQNGSIWARQNVRSSNIGYPHIFTRLIFSLVMKE